MNDSHESLDVQVDNGQTKKQRVSEKNSSHTSTSTPINRQATQKNVLSISPSRCIDTIGTLVDTRVQFQNNSIYEKYLQTPRDEVVDHITTLILNNDQSLNDIFPGFLDFFRVKNQPKSNFIQRYELIFNMMMATKFYPNGSSNDQKFDETTTKSPLKLTLRVKNPPINISDVETENEFVIVDN